MKKTNSGTRRCSQVKCSFYLKGGCKPCRSCKSGEYVIKTGCTDCENCENVPGACRFGDGMEQIEEELQILEEGN